jgi:hypothetical protein
MYDLKIIKPDGSDVIAGIDYTEHQKQDFSKYVAPLLSGGVVLVWINKEHPLVPYHIRAGIQRRW